MSVEGSSDVTLILICLASPISISMMSILQVMVAVPLQKGMIGYFDSEYREDLMAVFCTDAGPIGWD